MIYWPHMTYKVYAVSSKQSCQLMQSEKLLSNIPRKYKVNSCVHTFHLIFSNTDYIVDILWGGNLSMIFYSSSHECYKSLTSRRWVRISYIHTADAWWGHSLHCMAKINSHSQISRYAGNIFCLPHRPKFSDFFDLCLHWVSVVRAYNIHLYLVPLFFLMQNLNSSALDSFKVSSRCIIAFF